MSDDTIRSFAGNRDDMLGHPEKEPPLFPKDYAHLEKPVKDAAASISSLQNAIDAAKIQGPKPGLTPPGWLRPDPAASIPSWEKQIRHEKALIRQTIEAATAKGDAEAQQVRQSAFDMTGVSPEPPEQDRGETGPDAEISASQERMLDLLDPGEEGANPAPPADIEPDRD